mgnify:CR=1 FL=1
MDRSDVQLAWQEALTVLRLPRSNERCTATTGAALQSSTNTRIVNDLTTRSEMGTRK